MEHSFPKCYRLRKHDEFLLVQQCHCGKKLSMQHFVVIAARQTPQLTARVGITVSRRVGNAVTRNRIKRWVREVLRQHIEWLPTGHDVVVIARRNATGLRCCLAVEHELRCLERWLITC